MRILHFAPEPFFADLFRKWFVGYTSADLTGRKLDYAADLTALPFPNESYDVVYASHILEHIQDDRRALREIRRVLTPGGMAFLPVPIFEGVKTVEYPEPNPFETDHVRQPGHDYYDRYEEVFDRVVRYSSSGFPPHHQLYIHEDRSGWPTPTMPLKQPMQGTKHSDIVPVCYR